LEITIVTIEVMNRIPDWQKRVAGHAQSETSLAIDGGCRGEHWGEVVVKSGTFECYSCIGRVVGYQGKRNTLNLLKNLLALGAFESTDHRLSGSSWGENLSLDWNRHLNAYAVMHPLRLIFLGKKCLEKMFIPSPVGTKKAVPLC